VTKRKEESRARILEAAAELFRVKGFTATGVDELMSAAGLTAGAFYAHFDSKQDLFDCTLEHVLATAFPRLTKGINLAAVPDPIAEMMARYVSEAHRDHPELGCAIPAVAGEIARHSGKGPEILAKHLDRWAKLFARYLPGSAAERRREALRLISQGIGAVLLSRLVPERLSKEVLKAGRSLSSRK
jgi:TetR/AcrR family transcriptional repressor of nem operon